MAATYSPKYQWYVVFTLMIGYLFAFLDRTMIGLLVVPIQEDLQVSDTQMGLLMGFAFVILYSLASLPIGYMVDRYNRVNIVRAGALLWCGMTVACGLAQSFAVLFICRMAVGLGEAALTPSANSIISDYFKPEALGKALSGFNLGVAAGSGLSLVLGGQAIAWIGSLSGTDIPFISNFQPWQLVFILVGFAGIIFILMMTGVKEPIRTGRRSGAANWTLAETVSYFKENTGFYVTLFSAHICLTMVGYAALNWTPTFLKRIHGWSAVEAGVNYGAGAIIVGFFGMIAGGIVIDKWRTRGRKDAAWMVLLLVMIFLVPFFAIAPLFSNPWVTLVFIWIGSIGASVCVVVTPTIIMSASPNEARGVASALFYLSANLIGASLGPLSVALVTDTVFGDQDAVGKSMAIVCFVGAVGCIAFAAFGIKYYRRRLGIMDALTAQEYAAPA